MGDSRQLRARSSERYRQLRSAPQVHLKHMPCDVENAATHQEPELPVAQQIRALRVRLDGFPNARARCGNHLWMLSYFRVLAAFHMQKFNVRIQGRGHIGQMPTAEEETRRPP